MYLNYLRPMLYTQQFDETIHFYTEILGFTVGERNDDWGWANLYKDKVEIMLARPNAHEPFEKPVFTGSFYFNTTDINAAWERLKDRCRICYPLETFEWGMREFGIYDNNGYILQFGQQVEMNNE
jgi:uncharacterized glyoxalase superfamily protein PhnB